MSNLVADGHVNILRQKITACVDQSSELDERAEKARMASASMLTEFFQTKIPAPSIRLRKITRTQLLRSNHNLVWFRLTDNGRDIVSAFDHHLIVSVAEAALGLRAESNRESSSTAVDRALAGLFCRRLAIELFDLSSEKADQDLKLIKTTLDVDDMQLPSEIIDFEVFEVTNLTPDGAGNALFAISCDGSAQFSQTPEQVKIRSWGPALSEAANHASIELHGVIGTVRTTIAELLDLQPGTMLDLDGATIDNITMYSRGAKVMSGQLGEYFGRRAVKATVTRR